jgi:hypothetical protein
MTIVAPVMFIDGVVPPPFTPVDDANTAAPPPIHSMVLAALFQSVGTVQAEPVVRNTTVI